MKKADFIDEVNRSYKSANLTDKALGYEYKEDQVVGSGIYHATAKATITLNGHSKTYQAGDGSTFPYEFVEDLMSGEFAA